MVISNSHVVVACVSRRKRYFPYLHLNHIYYHCFTEKRVTFRSDKNFRIHTKSLRFYASSFKQGAEIVSVGRENGVVNSV